LWEGSNIGKFERAFAEYIGTPDAVTVPSGRGGFKFLFDGLQLGPGTEVICSAFGYPIVPFLVKSLGYDLKFVDCEMQTLGMDPELLKKTISRHTGAVIGTHLYGIPCQVDKISELAKQNDAFLIEDCAHCYGAAIGDRKVGSFGAAGCFSFETSKVINTMGGGMVTVKMNGQQEVLGITIDEEVFGEGDKEMLEDLIVAAMNEARQKANEIAKEQMSSITGGMNIPGLM
jgi:perosamine synthetase